MEIEIIEGLAQYGVLGLWTISLLVERFLHNKKTTEVIENNTTALVKIYEVVSGCPRRKV